MRHCGKSAVSFARHRQHRFVVRIDAENDFVLGIIQPAEAGQIFAGVRIEPANRLQDADRRRERRRPARSPVVENIARNYRSR